MMISPGVFFHFFDIFLFWAVKGVKGKKMAKYDKTNLSVAVDISGTMYHMILIYGALV